MALANSIAETRSDADPKSAGKGTKRKPTSDNVLKGSPTKKLKKVDDDGFKVPEPKVVSLAKRELVQHDSSKDHLTAFISNLSFDTDEVSVKKLFSGECNSRFPGLK